MEGQLFQRFVVFLHLFFAVVCPAVRGLLRGEVFLDILCRDSQMVGSIEVGDQLADEQGMEGAELPPYGIRGKRQVVR